MKGRRVTVEVSWNLDACYGWNYEPQDVIDLIQREALDRIPHYEPRVELKDDRSELHVSGGGASGLENSQIPKDSSEDQNPREKAA